MIFLKIYFISLKGRIVETEKERERDHKYTGSLPRLLQKSGPGQAGARNSIHVSHLGSSGPGTWATFCYIFRHISKELDWELSSQDLTQCSAMGY